MPISVTSSWRSDNNLNIDTECKLIIESINVYGVELYDEVNFDDKIQYDDLLELVADTITCWKAENVDREFIRARLLYYPDLFRRLA